MRSLVRSLVMVGLAAAVSCHSSDDVHVLGAGSGGAFGAGAIIPVDRMIDWSHAGVVQPNGTQGIPNRTTICATLDAAVYGDGITDAGPAIQAAIDGCPANQVVSLPAGTYKLGTKVWVNHSVVLRGAGTTKTKIVESAGNNILFSSFKSAEPNANQLHAVDWTAGYARGSTTITLADASNLKVGQAIVLDQLNDTDVSAPGYLPLVSPVGSDGTCGLGANDCISPVDGPHFCTDGAHVVPRALMQTVEIQSIAGNDVTIAPPLYVAHLASLQPQAFLWDGDDLRYAGVENLTVDGQNGDAALQFSFCAHCWVKGVEIDHFARGAVSLSYDRHFELRDSRIFMNKAAAPENYGVEIYDTTDSRFENNILEALTSGIEVSYSSNGNVIAYNYATGAAPGAQTIYSDMGTHSVHAYMNLWEGNVVTQMAFDVVWGSASHQTLFRNRVTGYLPPRPGADGSLWSGWNWPVLIQAWQRDFNVVGNVLGTAGVQNGYQAANAPIATGVTAHTSTCGSPSCGLSVGPIYILGYWRVNDTTDMTNYDPLTARTLLRWGNYDAVTDAARWEASEIPTGVPVPTTKALPASLYLPSKPSFFGAVPWPAIGPDVTGGNATQMVNKIPAQLCYEAGPGSGHDFDPAACY
jgi:hypothetical protein